MEYLKERYKISECRSCKYHENIPFGLQETADTGRAGLFKNEDQKNCVHSRTIWVLAHSTHECAKSAEKECALLYQRMLGNGLCIRSAL